MTDETIASAADGLPPKKGISGTADVISSLRRHDGQLPTQEPEGGRFRQGASGADQRHDHRRAGGAVRCQHPDGDPLLPDAGLRRVSRVQAAAGAEPCGQPAVSDRQAAARTGARRYGDRSDPRRAICLGQRHAAADRCRGDGARQGSPAGDPASGFRGHWRRLFQCGAGGGEPVLPAGDPGGCRPATATSCRCVRRR